MSTKLLYALGLVINSYCYAADWHQLYQDGLEAVENISWKKAEQYFTEAIENGGRDHASIYVDRAKVYFEERKYLEAIDDTDMALHIGLETYDKERALSIRSLSFFELGEETEAVKDYQECRTPPSILANVEVTDDAIIFTNTPHDFEAKRMLKNMIVGFYKCKKDDLIELPEGALMIRKP